jgi:tetrapyrrole methylase family protein/MazG family protein
MIDFENKPEYDVGDLKRIIELLRGDGGCPWDFEQTHESIRRNLIEEAYEAAEAIDEGDPDHLLEELGDVLIQIVFHSDIEEKAGRFTLQSVADAACRKLIHRHPHVFGGVHVKDSDEVLQNWDAIKREEKLQDTTADAMRSVARSLPALWRAEKVQKKAAKVGFDFPDCKGAIGSLRSEVSELEAAAATAGHTTVAGAETATATVGAADTDTATAGTADDPNAGIAEELGDVMFSAVNVARFAGVDPEQALALACDKFISRFGRLEDAARGLGMRLEDMTPERMDELYEQVK